jgi:hypothetical protein
MPGRDDSREPQIRELAPDTLAPALTLPARAGRHIATVLAAHDVPDTIMDEELRHMREPGQRPPPTAASSES